MKYSSLIFTKVLSGLFQQRILTAEKRNALMSEWRKSISEGSREKLCDLLSELLYLVDNKVWKKELGDAMDMILEGRV